MLKRIVKLFRSDPPPAVRSYDGAGAGRRWRGAGEMPASLPAMLSSRGPLLRRARYLAVNNPLAASAVEAWVSALIGTGIKAQSAHDDAGLREALNVGFEAWTDHADADGTADLYGLQALMARRLVIDGEAFAVLVHDHDGRARIRLIDAEQVDASLTRPTTDGGRIVQGVELDATGTRIAYWILPERPGLAFDALALTPRRIDARDVIHLFKPETPGQVRGVSWFAPVMLRLADLDGWRDAQLMRQKTAAMLAGFITSADVSGAPMEGENDGMGNLVGGLEPGTLKFLDPGQSITFSSPANIGVEVIDFANITEREIAVGLGLPAHVLTGNLSDTNYSSARAGLIEWRRRVEALQHGLIAFQALRPIWNRWAATEVLSGRVQTTVEAAQAVRWIVPKQAWVDPAKDVQAEIDAITAGLMSRREAVASRGYDIERLDAEIAADNARAGALGLNFAHTKEVAPND